MILCISIDFFVVRQIQLLILIHLHCLSKDKINYTLHVDQSKKKKIEFSISFFSLLGRILLHTWIVDWASAFNCWSWWRATNGVLCVVEFVDQYNQYQRTVRTFLVVIRNIRNDSANCKTSKNKIYIKKNVNTTAKKFTFFIR